MMEENKIYAMYCEFVVLNEINMIKWLLLTTLRTRHAANPNSSSEFGPNGSGSGSGSGSVSGFGFGSHSPNSSRVKNLGNSPNIY